MDRFIAIVEKTLKHEGGYVWDKRDPGGATAYGIASKYHPKEFKFEYDSAGNPIKCVSYPTKARAIEIYRKEYWEKPKIHLIENDIIAAKVFDLGVNCGHKRSIMFLQKALGVTVDGVMGAKTAAAANCHKNYNELLTGVKKHAKDYYVSLNKPHYIKGWLRRLDS